jgi:hypothetical protein
MVPEPEPLDARPWERPGAIRRDCDSHRGTELRMLGGLALLCGCLSAFCLGLSAPLGVCLGGFVLWAAGRDLGLMWEGRMDPAGWEETKLGRGMAGIGVLTGDFFGLIWAGAYWAE